MDPTQLARRLVESAPDDRERLLRKHAPDADAGLARALHQLYLEKRTGDPAISAAAAASVELLARVAADPEIAAVAAWTSGMAAMHLEGQMERAVGLLHEAADRFTALDRPLDVAASQVSALQGLAMLGHYDEAIAVGLAARDTFEAHHDLLAAGKIEQNLGNIYYRRGRFEEAERLYLSARKRYLRVGNDEYLAQIDTCLGTVLSDEHRFAEATAAFEEALQRAEASGLELTQTDIRYNLGLVGLFQGRYNRALDYLEGARRTFAQLRMPHRAAEAELELVDAYLELNMPTEAATIASRLAETFEQLGMRAEQARALGSNGRAAALLGESAEARRLLAKARELYAAEGNALEAGFMTLVEAQLAYAEGNFDAAMRAAEQSESPFAHAHAWGRLLLARWLQGEAARAAGKPEARALLESALQEAQARELPQISYRCLTSLGLLAATHGDLADAQRAFELSVGVIETLRAPLPAEEFRAAYLSDKLTPFSELARLALAEGVDDSAARAFSYVERARSRALVDMMAGVVTAQSRPRDAFEAELVQAHDRIREELQWFYSQINRPEGAAGRGAEAMEELYAQIREREARAQDLRRQIEQRGGQMPGRVAPLNVLRLQAALDQQAALVEYFSLDGILLAFIVTGRGIEVVRDLGPEATVDAAVSQLRFQIDTLRFAGEMVNRHRSQLVERARRHLSELYDVLLRPIEPYVGDCRLIIVPHRSLHYVPFHALYDGCGYVVQRRAVSYAPSAGVLLYCLEKDSSPIERTLLVGVADEQTPRVRDEVRAIAQLLPEPTVLLDDAATVAAVRSLASDADVLHLACHGQFRPDNPLFSSLRLGDGWLTVRDAYDLELACQLVTLSACETGVSAVAPGEELLGLARGFFSAGTPSLLVSLWTVDDASTAELMTEFYTGLQSGLGPADALAKSQRDLIERYGHPYYWSAFAVLGRW